MKWESKKKFVGSNCMLHAAFCMLIVENWFVYPDFGRVERRVWSKEPRLKLLKTNYDYYEFYVI